MCTGRPYEDIISLGTTVTMGCVLPYGCWELNPDPLEELPVLLTAEPALRPFLYRENKESLTQISSKTRY